jgi:hypothetical protein
MIPLRWLGTAVSRSQWRHNKTVGAGAAGITSPIHHDLISRRSRPRSRPRAAAT